MVKSLIFGGLKIPVLWTEISWMSGDVLYHRKLRFSSGGKVDLGLIQGRKSGLIIGSYVPWTGGYPQF